MSTNPPTPPADSPSDLIDRLNSCSSDQLREISQYADALATHKDRSAEATAQEEEDRPEDRPEDVPSKATITIKEINDNRYYYWQWREDDKIKSKYKAPANPDE